MSKRITHKGSEVSPPKKTKGSSQQQLSLEDLGVFRYTPKSKASSPETQQQQKPKSPVISSSPFKFQDEKDKDKNKEREKDVESALPLEIEEREFKYAGKAKVKYNNLFGFGSKPSEFKFINSLEEINALRERLFGAPSSSRTKAPIEPSVFKLTWGLVYAKNESNFNKVLPFKTTKSVNTNEKPLGVVFQLDPEGKESFYLSLSSKSTEDEISYDDRLSLFVDFIESTSIIEKICFFTQNSLHPYYAYKLTKPGNVDKFPINLQDPMVASWVYESNEKFFEGYSWDKIVSFVNLSAEHEKDKIKPIHEKTVLFQNMTQLWNVHESLIQKLENQSLLTAYEKEMPITAVLSEMEVVGVGFDKSSLSTYRNQMKQKLDSICKQACELVGYNFNLASSQQVSHVLFTVLKLKDPTSTRTSTLNVQSTNDKVLKAMLHLHPLPNLILEYRHLNKMLSTWIDALEELAELDKLFGMRLHTSWHQTVVVTGRLSSSSPNLQNLPKNVYSMKDEKEGEDDAIGFEDEDQEKPDSQIEELEALEKIQNLKDGETKTDRKTDIAVNVRDAIVSREGYTLVGADYSQIEIRILAHLTKDPVLIKAYRNKEDIHLQIAAKWLGKSAADVTESERNQAKKIVFGVLYGMSVQSLAEMIKVTKLQAAKFIKDFLGKYPQVQKFITETVASANKKHEIRTYSGRRRTFSDFDNSDYREKATFQRQAVNSVIQGSASDIIKLAMLRLQISLRKKDLPARIVLQVHDELVVEARDDIVELVKHELKDAMENAIDLFVPLEVSMFVGKKWGSMTNIKVIDEGSSSSSSSGPCPK